jgi:hypothetical protein
MEVRALTGFNHGPYACKRGDKIDVSEKDAKELTEKGLVERADAAYDRLSGDEPNPDQQLGDQSHDQQGKDGSGIISNATVPSAPDNKMMPHSSNK